MRKHGCSLSLVLEREVLAATQRNLGGSGGSSSRGGVPQSRPPLDRLAAGFGDLRCQDPLRKVRTRLMLAAFHDAREDKFPVNRRCQACFGGEEPLGSGISATLFNNPTEPMSVSYKVRPHYSFSH